MNREVPQNLNRLNFSQMIPGSRRLSATVAESYQFVFPYNVQAIAGSCRLSYDYMETML